MGEGATYNGAVEWRLKQLEIVQKAIQHDLYNERIARETTLRELRKEIREEYMNKDQLDNAFVQKKDVIVTKREKREWWALIPIWVAGGVALADIIFRIH